MKDVAGMVRDRLNDEANKSTSVECPACRKRSPKLLANGIPVSTIETNNPSVSFPAVRTRCNHCDEVLLVHQKTGRVVNHYRG